MLSEKPVTLTDDFTQFIFYPTRDIHHVILVWINFYSPFHWLHGPGKQARKPTEDKNTLISKW
jgi:hypothetical protein